MNAFLSVFNFANISNVTFVLLALLVWGGLILVLAKDVKAKRTSYIGSYIAILWMVAFVVAPVCIYFFALGVNKSFNRDSLLYFMNLSMICVAFFIVPFSLAYCFRFKNSLTYIKFSDSYNYDCLTLFIFVFVLICFSGFVYLYGGIDYVLSNVSRIRSGTDENKNYLGAIVRLFTYFISLVLFYVYAKSLLVRSAKVKAIFYFVLVIATCKVFLDGGRGGVLQIFIGILFVYFFAKGRFPIKFVTFLIPIMIFIGIYGKTYLFQLFSGGRVEFVSASKDILGYVDIVLSAYSHQFLSLTNAIALDAGGSRYFQDFSVIFFKPLKLFGIDVPDAVSYYNTFLIKGVWDSEIPPGPIALFFFQGHLFLIPVFGVLMGVVLKRIDSIICLSLIFNENGREKSFAIASFAVVVIYLPYFFMNSDPALTIQWWLAYLLLYFVLFCCGIWKIVVRAG